MTGRIFPTSNDVYDDQAEILFEYYRQAAEAIVAEEEQIERDMAVVREEQVQLAGRLRDLSVREKLAYGAAVVCAGLAILPSLRVPGIVAAVAAGLAGAAMFVKRKRLGEELHRARTTQSTLEASFRDVRRDYRVTKLGVAYVPVAGLIPFEGKSFLVDFTESVQPQEFRLSTVRRGELFVQTIKDLEGLVASIPLVEGASEIEEVATEDYSRSIQSVSYYDYLGGLDRKLRTTAYCLDDLETNSVSLPVIFPDTDMARFLDEYATDDPGSAPVLGIFPTDTYDAELAAFRDLNTTKKALERETAQFEEVLRQMMSSVATTVHAVTTMKLASAHGIVAQSNRTLFRILQAPYNHYSPRLEADEIERIRLESFDYQESVDSYREFQLKESSRVSYDPISESWIAEDGSRTGFPFAIPSIEEEIIGPIVQNLMLETRLERLKIYNGIKDQKLDYLNKWQQEIGTFFAHNRAASADLMNQMRSSFTEFMSAYTALSALERTDKTMVASGSIDDSAVAPTGNLDDVVASYEIKARDYQAVQEDFEGYMDRLQEDIARRAAKFGFIEYYDASLRDSNAKRISEASARTAQLDERRKPLLAVNAFFAESSELQPSPTIEPLGAEHAALNLETIARNSLAMLATNATGTAS